MFEKEKLYIKIKQLHEARIKNLKKRARQADYLSYYAYKRSLTQARKARRTEERSDSQHD
jgi:hypothetical protein